MSKNHIIFLFNDVTSYIQDETKSTSLPSLAVTFLKRSGVCRGGGGVGDAKSRSSKFLSIILKRKVISLRCDSPHVFTDFQDLIADDRSDTFD